MIKIKKFIKFLTPILILAIFVFFPASTTANIGLSIGHSGLTLDSFNNLLYGNLSSASHASSSFFLFQKNSSDIVRLDNFGNFTTLGNIGIGLSNPSTSLQITNDNWISSTGAGGTGIINMFKVNSNNQIEVGAALNIGSFEFTPDSGLVSFLDMPVTSSSAVGTPHGYIFKTDSENILTIYSESNGSGGIQNKRVGINTFLPGSALEIRGGGSTSASSALNVTNSGAVSSLFVRNDGNIGIGITNPTQKLHINGVTQLDSVSFGITPGEGQTLALATVDYVNNKVSSGGGSSLWTENGSNIYYNLGNVGIGLTNPSQKLEITNNFKIPTTSGTTQGVIYQGNSRFIHSQGTGNVFVGQNAGNLTLTASNNVAIGTQALLGNTSGSMNVAIGADALANTTSGPANVAVGASSMEQNISGMMNVAVGMEALESNTTGTGNISIGYWSGAATYTANPLNPSNSIYIGHSTLGLASDEANAIVLGSNNTSLGSNSVLIGNDSTLKTVLKGNVGIGNTAPNYILDVNGGANLNAVSFGVTPGEGQTLALATVDYVNNKVGSGGGSSLWTENGSNIFYNLGNVGIGTSVPGNALEIKQGSDTYNGGLAISNSAASQRIFLWVDSNNVRRISAGSTESSVISLNGTGTGNVGIGVTNPTRKLAIVDPGVGFDRPAVNSLGIFTSNIERIRVLANGNVGIGTSAPPFFVAIDNSAANLLLIGNSTNGGILFGNNNGAAKVVSYNGSGYNDMDIRANATFANQLYLTTGGNIGIGITNPVQKLHVSGGLQLDSVSFGVTPGEGQTLALATVDYVNNKVGSGGQWTTTSTNIFYNSGHVIIGAEDSSTRLHVETAAGPVAFFKSNLLGGTYAGYIGNLQTFSLEEFGLYTLPQYRLAAYDQTNGLYLYGGFQDTDVGITIDSLTGNVGIGTTAPTQRIDIPSGNMRFAAGNLIVGNGYGIIDSNTNNQRIYVDSTKGVIFNTGSGSSDERMRIDLSGNIGIGITNPLVKLAFPTATKIGFKDASYEGTIEFYNNATGNMTLQTTFGTGNVNILPGSSGNVGINTTLPSEKLEVNGKIKVGNNTVSGENITFDGSTAAGLRLQNTSGYISLTPLNTSWAHIYTDRPRFIFNTEVQIIGGILNAYNNTDLRLGTASGAEKMRITTGGNIGIGITNPTSILHVYEGTTAGNSLALFRDNPAISSLEIISRGSDIMSLTAGTGDVLRLASNNNANGNIEIKTDGNVGIGTTNPGYLLDVNGTINATSVLINGSPISGGGSSLWTENGSDIYYNSGNVGIGTTAPAEKLDVEGNVEADAYYYSSDVRLKTDIKALNNSLEKIKRLNPVSFAWKKDGVLSQGFIAQEVEWVLPELVKTNSETNLKSVQYANLTAILVAGMKEQQAQIEKLQTEVRSLQQKLLDLEK